MIDAFVDSWPLFWITYLSGWAIAALLGLVGVWVVARDQVFLGIAVAQASALGIAAALWLGASAGASAIASDALASFLAVVAAVATALLTARSRREGRESPEAVTGWVYLLAASLPVLLLAHSPHGLEEIHRLAFSTLLGATGADLVGIACVLVATVVLAVPFHRSLLVVALDPDMAVASGLSRRGFTLAMAAWLGLCVGLSMRVSGMLYTFGCLVLPALIAKNLCREIQPLLWAAPLIALAAAIAGSVLAHWSDVPPAHATVALLCAALALAWVWHARRGR